MSKTIRWLSKKEAEVLDFKIKENKGNRKQSRYFLTEEQWHSVLKQRTKPKKRKSIRSNFKSKISLNEKPFLLSAWSDKGFMMDIEEYCDYYKLPKKDIKSYKLVTHTGTPFYNIQFKENLSEVVESFDFKSVIEKYINPIILEKVDRKTYSKDFDTLTITDVHIGMETDIDNNTMYVKEWNKKELIKTADIVIEQTLEEQASSVLYVDELGDLLDGFNAQTTRGGHALPQNMTNEECFDAALEFKLKILYGLVNNYTEIHFNNICNDNHSGAFGYFVNEAFKQIAELQFKNVTVTNHRKFLNHYYVGKICFIISHGKDDKSLKFGFKPQLDLKGAEKIDQYCKQNGIYKESDLVIFKKGDSHQALFDMCTSDDFYYFNYPALSPSSNWIKNNFKLGRRGFVNESFKGLKNYMKTHFIK